MKKHTFFVLKTSLGVSILLLTGCEILTTEGRLLSDCRKQIISNLNDPSSYREDGKPIVAQSIKGEPPVYSWPMNARNAMGGYGNSVEALCYNGKTGMTVATVIENSDEGKARRNEFLSQTNPELKRQLDAQKAEILRAKQEYLNVLEEGNRRILEANKRASKASDEYLEYMRKLNQQ